MNTSSWILSLRQRMLENRPDRIFAANSSCRIRDYVYVVPMSSKSEVLQAVKEFAKEIGAPEAVICDAAREQKSKSLRKFLGEIGTTLRILEEGTPWANKAELYIGLIKEAVRKDMKDSDCPLAFLGLLC